MLKIGVWIISYWKNDDIFYIHTANNLSPKTIHELEQNQDADIDFHNENLSCCLVWIYRYFLLKIIFIIKFT